MDGGSHKKDEAEAPGVPPSPEVPGVPEHTIAPEGSVEDALLSDSDDGTNQTHDSDEGGSSGDSDSTDEYVEPIYDKANDIYRCANIDCGWEVAFGYCHGCQTEYMVEVRS